MRGSLGLVIGAVIGAGGMYLALRPPWAKVAVPSSPGMVVQVTPDAGAPGKKKRPRRSVAQPTPGGEDSYEETEPELPKLTDADRRLEWRGDEVALPVMKIDMATKKESRPLEDEEINAAIGGQTGGVRECVTQGAMGTDLAATITVKMLVDGTGRVTRSRLQAPRYLLEKGLLGCTQRALGRLRFPATGAPTLVTFPVNLG